MVCFKSDYFEAIFPFYTSNIVVQFTAAEFKSDHSTPMTSLSEVFSSDRNENHIYNSEYGLKSVTLTNI